MAEPIPNPQIAQFLIDYPNRQLDGNMLVAAYDFETFLEAIDFVTQIAEVIEHLQHHPDILIQYTSVTLSTTTHDAGDQITEKDLELVKQIEELF